MRKEAKKFTLLELAELTKAHLIGDANHCITGAEALESADSEDASFLANPLYREAMQKSKAGVICVDPSISLIQGKNFLVSDSPSLVFQTIVKLLLTPERNESGFQGIHPSAIIHPETEIGKDVTIGPFAVIDRGVEIGDHCNIRSFVFIGAGVKIGAHCTIHPHAVVREGCVLGNRVVLQPGAVIGSCGFGYTTDAKGRHTKLDQLGCVIIEDDVEIGANTTIDRARFKGTRICRGTKIDNLVQIAHNVGLGQDNIIVSQTGIAGSVKTGKNVVLAGQVGVVGHIEIGDGVIVAAKGGISKSMPKAGRYAGVPVMPLEDYNRQQVQLRKIGSYVKRIEELEKRLKQLETLLS
jgi:UDP-3-O-[3-hydroxymyristoyl] glucosamine N-acyltransferase